MKKLFLLAGILSVIGFATVNAPSDKTGKGGFTSPTTTKGDLIVRNSTIDTRLGVGANGLVLTADSAEATGVKWSSVAGTGDVVGPASATDNAVCRFDGTTGKAVQNSGASIDDNGYLTVNGVTSTVSSGNSLVLRKSNFYPSMLFDTEGENKDWLLSTDASAGKLLFYNDAAAEKMSLSQDGDIVNSGDLSVGDTATLGPNGGSQAHQTNGTMKIVNASGPHLALQDGGTFGTDADPFMTFRDTSGVGASVGFTGAASNNFLISNARSTGNLTFQTNSTTGMVLDSSGDLTFGPSGGTGTHIWNGANFAGVGSTSTSEVTVYRGGHDTANMKLQGGTNANSGIIRLYGSTHATAPGETRFANGGNQTGSIDTNGKWAIGRSGQTHDVTGDVTISGLTASKVVVTNGSKKLISSTMSQTTLEALTGEQIDGLIESPAATTYILRLNAKYAGTINNISIKTSAGTITAKLQIEGVDVTSCTGIAVTSTESTTTCTAANSVSAGDTITLVTSSLSAATNLAFSVGMTRN